MSGVSRRAGLASAFALLLALGLALPASAQTPGIPDVPGSGAIRRAIQDSLRSVARPPTAAELADVIRSAAAAGPQATMPPMAAPESLDPAPSSPQTTRPAARRPSGRSLPATGVPAAGLGFLGIALLSGGRLLVELTRR